MARFLHQVLVQDEALAVSTQVTFDLPVNPLSVVYITLRNLNDTTDLDDFTSIQNLLTQISRLEILFKGSAIVSASLADLARLAALRMGRSPMQTASAVTTNSARSITVPIMLGRKPFWMEECFPAVRRGELQLQLTSAAAQTGVDTLTLQIETLELLEATPKRFIKTTTISKTPNAVGDHDLDLPIGNKITDLLLFGTTVPTGANLTASFGQTRLLVDNTEHDYAAINWETLHNMAAARYQESVAAGQFISRENDAAAYAQDALTDGEHAQVGFLDNYALLDFDPRGDDAYLLETAGKARVHLRINADVADAIRVLPSEIIEFEGSAP